MYLGSLVELAESYELNKNPLHPYTKTLLSAVPVPDPEVSRQRQRNALETQLRHAVETENFEEAAKLRDQLRSLPQA